jgi:hypothetical protein
MMFYECLGVDVIKCDLIIESGPRVTCLTNRLSDSLLINISNIQNNYCKAQNLNNIFHNQPFETNEITLRNR